MFEAQCRYTVQTLAAVLPGEPIVGGQLHRADIDAPKLPRARFPRRQMALDSVERALLSTG